MSDELIDAELDGAFVHERVKPFMVEHTGLWRERAHIAEDLEKMREAIEEVLTFTKKDGGAYNIPEADDSMRNLHRLAFKMFPQPLEERRHA